MGTRGKRTISHIPAERSNYAGTVPALLRSASDLRNLGRQNGCYNNLILDVVKLLQFIPDVRLEYVEMDSTLSGSLSRANSYWLIQVNKSHSKIRQRFTIAHELGHYIYHKDDGDKFVDTTFFRGMSSNNLEFTANKFASDLLMPEEDVRQLIETENVRSVAELATKFGVSSAAMLYRVKELNYKTKE